MTLHTGFTKYMSLLSFMVLSSLVIELHVSKSKKKKMMKNVENRPFLFNPFPKHVIG